MVRSYGVPTFTINIVASLNKVTMIIGIMSLGYM